MTIKFTEQHLEYGVDQIRDLSDDDEAAFIALGVAVAFNKQTYPAHFNSDGKLINPLDGTTVIPGQFGAVTSTSVTSTGSITSSGGGVGYATGAGGEVIQITSKSTSVTLNKLCGQIQTHGGEMLAGAEESFTVNNSTVAATDVVVVSIKSGATLGAYLLSVGLTSVGQFMVVISNVSAGALSDNIVLNYAVIKAVSA